MADVRPSRYARVIPPDWKCPGCGVSRSEDRVVLHHDHIEDYVVHVAKNMSVGREMTNCDDLAPFIRCVRLFPPTLICELCNHLDGSHLQPQSSARWFSLQPVDLAELHALLRGAGERTVIHRRKMRASQQSWSDLALQHRKRLREVELLLPHFHDDLEKGIVARASTTSVKGRFARADALGTPRAFCAEDQIEFTKECAERRYAKLGQMFEPMPNAPARAGTE